MDKVKKNVSCDCKFLAMMLAKIREKDLQMIKKQNEISDEIRRRRDEEQDIKEAKKLEDRERKKEMMRKMLKELEENRQKRQKQEMDIKLWETMQRYKRVEFNNQWELKYREEMRQNRLQYGKVLKRQMVGLFKDSLCQFIDALKCSLFLFCYCCCY